jgi:ketol-acid reductoisomerase
MRDAISTTARFGAMQGGPRIITEATRAEMRRILAEVRAGKFTHTFVAEAEAGHPRMQGWSAHGTAHPIEEVRQRLDQLRKR